MQISEMQISKAQSCVKYLKRSGNKHKCKRQAKWQCFESTLIKL